MHLLLNNLTDKELLLRIKKFQDREAAGVLLDRYSHLLVAVSLPRFTSEKTAEVALPELTRQLYTRIQSAFGKLNESVYALVQSYFGKGSSVPVFYPNQALYRLETRIEHAGNNPIAKEALMTHLEKALTKLNAEDLQLITQFYLEQQSFSDIAKKQNISKDKVRHTLKGVKKKLATHLMDQAYE
ncbi:hypothetical protein AAHN97_13200 [Chitinophaga niabensis]|uniref:hypothetical protein n=1 Tax=Chitinophaga niabensis TaxID=536979 RepID=UPI0031BAC7D4